MKDKKNKRSWGGAGNLSYKQAKSMATSAPMRQRNPAGFNGQEPITGPFSKAAEANRAQDKQMRQMQKGVKKAVSSMDLDITGAQKAKIFDQIQPNNNQPQRGKLGY
tara:strand:- start:35 stop:355 length:321 start_codon:yes stop_codon:yes gene_type:complete